jgi:hypothetical protein
MTSTIVEPMEQWSNRRFADYCLMVAYDLEHNAFHDLRVESDEIAKDYREAARRVLLKDGE